METTAEFEARKQNLFATALKLFKKYDEADNTDSELSYWKRYAGMFKAIEIMGWEREFVDYCLKNGWEVFVP